MRVNLTTFALLIAVGSPSVALAQGTIPGPPGALTTAPRSLDRSALLLEERWRGNRYSRRSAWRAGGSGL